MPWLKLHDPSLVWSKRQLLFKSYFCQSSCLKLRSNSVSQSPVEPSLIPVSSSLYLVSSAPPADSDLPVSLKSLVPVYYYDILDVFSKEKSNTLPSHGPYDHKISLENGKAPPFGPIYPMNRIELQVLSEYIKENL
jgi:hypothetical protein